MDELTPAEQNSVFAVMIGGRTVEQVVEICSDFNEAAVRAFYEKTAKWMEDNPLPPGAVYDMAPMD